MIIKVCGLRDKENIEAVAALNADYLGFIFYEKSPRFVHELAISAFNNVPETVIKTAVFVNERAENVNKLIDTYNFDAIQLHGEESPEFCIGFRDKVKVIKAFGVNSRFNFADLNAYKDSVDLFLFDTKTESYGGSGLTFDWNMLNHYQLDVPFFLSGGISIDNLAELKNIKHPRFYGVDLNSKFEISPGLKDIEQLNKAFKIIKQQIIK